MTTWGTIDNQLSLLLDDPNPTDADKNPSYPEALRILVWNRACQYFASTHTAPLTAAELSPATGTDALADGMVAAFPTDYLQIGGIKRLGAWMVPGIMVPGEIADTVGSYALTEQGIYFPDPEVGTVVLWYYRQYADVAEVTEEGAEELTPASDFVLETPIWAEWPLINLTVAYLLTPGMIGMADLRRFQSKREAGGPEDNSMRSQARYHMQIYMDYLRGHKPQDREMLFKSIR